MKFTGVQLRELLKSDAEVTGNRLAKAIEIAELTQAQLAAAINLTQPYVSDVARGRHDTITVDNAHKFAEFFGCDIKDLFPKRAA
ncbi:MAG: helix-turn-helix transcriptional regulator [Vicinamibacterales bacterium]